MHSQPYRNKYFNSGRYFNSGCNSATNVMINFKKHLYESCAGMLPQSNINRAFTTDGSERLLTGRKDSNQFKTQFFAHRWNICTMCKQCPCFTSLALYWIITLEILSCPHITSVYFDNIPKMTRKIIKYRRKYR